MITAIETDLLQQFALAFRADGCSRRDVGKAIGVKCAVIEQWEKQQAQQERQAKLDAKRKAKREANLDETRQWVAANHPELADYLVITDGWDGMFEMRSNLRKLIARTIQQGIERGKGVKLLGCSGAEARALIEAQFRPGMTWRNWSFDGWHLDHIKPLIDFDLNDPEQVKQACNITNLCPLWAEENIRKNALPGVERVDRHLNWFALLTWRIWRAWRRWRGAFSEPLGA